VTYLDLHYTIDMIVIFSIPIIGFLYLLVPLIFVTFGPSRRTRRRTILSKLFRSCVNERKLVHVLIIIFAILSAIILILSFPAFALKPVSEYTTQFVSSKAVRGDYYEFLIDICILIILLLLPISTVLIALLWHPTGKLYRLRISVLAVAVWFIVRICFIGVFFIGRISEFRDYPLVPQLNQTPGLRYYIPGSVFGGFTGLIVCITICLVGILISIPFIRRQRIEVKYLTFAACLSPIILLIFAGFKITFGFVTIDFAVTALTLGWLLSATARSKSARTVETDECSVSNRRDYNLTASVQGEKLMSPDRSIVDNLTFLSAMSRAVRFIFTAIIPAILLKWAFHNIFGLRLDGAAGSWAMIWIVALGLGLITFAVTRFYDRRDLPMRNAVATFLCAFAIMIQPPINLLANILPIGNLSIGDIFIAAVAVLGILAWTTTLILVLGTLALITTVVLDKHQWTWPFWACYLFIYIFVHSMAGSGYATDLSKLDLFSWINMSVIVFVFLFAIPIYFASNGFQRRTLATMPDEQSG